MKAKRRTGIVTDPRYKGHCMGPDQPECPERLAVLEDMLTEPDLQGALHLITPRRAEPEELLRVHAPDYIRSLAATAGKDDTYLDPDTRTSPRSHEAALLAAGGLCRAIERVQAGEVDNVFALVRPPGHHAERTAAKGFCLYNNIAVGASYIQRSLGLERILVVDWDLHHGNGTQHCFEENQSVLFFSIHRSFFYPGSGRLREVGRGAGKGYTLNIPLLKGFGDGEYLCLFEKILKPVAYEFKPDFVLVSAGFDIHFKDPLGGMRVTPQGFAGMTRVVLDIADRCCGGKVVMSLEGGYDLEGLRDSVRAVLKEMAGLQFTDSQRLMSTADRKRVDHLLWRIGRVHRNFWPCLVEPGPGAAVSAPGILTRLREFMLRLGAYFKS